MTADISCNSASEGITYKLGLLKRLTLCTYCVYSEYVTDIFINSSLAQFSPRSGDFVQFIYLVGNECKCVAFSRV